MPTKKDSQIVFRSSFEVVQRAEALIDHVAAAQGIDATKTDVFRAACMIGLRELEKQAEKAGAPARRRRSA